MPKDVFLGLKSSFHELLPFCHEILLAQTLLGLQQLLFEVHLSSTDFSSSGWWTISLTWYYVLIVC